MINALGLDKESSFSAIIEGKCGIRTIESFDTEGQSVTIAGEIPNFDVSDVLDRKEAKKADRFIQLGLKAADEAIKDANFSDDVDMERFGIASASGIGGLPNIEKNSVVCKNRGPRKISPFFIPFFIGQYAWWIYLYLPRDERTKSLFCHSLCSRHPCHR